jgi:hypothetical protein
MAKTKKYNSKGIDVISCYSYREKWNTILPQTVYDKLFLELEKNPIPFKNFKIDIAIHFLGLLISIPAKKKDKYYRKGFVSISSKYLQGFRKNYKDYFAYFEKIDLVEINHSYSTELHFSKSYRLKFNDHIDVEYVYHKTIDREFLRKLNKNHNDYTLNETHNHLTKWFNENLAIDFEKSKAELKNKLYSIKNRHVKKTAERHWTAVLSLKEHDFHFSRSIAKDYRFHTIFTRFPKIYKKYVTYDGESLASFDIKNSQPFFLVILIEDLLKNSISMNNKYTNEIFSNIYNMLPQLRLIIEDKEFKDEYKTFKQWVVGGRFYEELGDLFPNIKADENKKFHYTFFQKDLKRRVHKVYDEKRDMMKQIALNILYTPLKKSSKEYKEFKKHFPKLCEFTECIKTENTYYTGKDKYKFFPKVLQHIESKCVLDFVAKKFSKKYPNIPIWTIHDSWVTTKSNIDILEKEVKNLLFEYCNGVMPKLEKEHWNKNQNTLVKETYNLVA